MGRLTKVQRKDLIEYIFTFIEKQKTAVRRAEVNLFVLSSDTSSPESAPKRREYLCRRRLLNRRAAALYALSKGYHDVDLTGEAFKEVVDYSEDQIKYALKKLVEEGRVVSVKDKGQWYYSSKKAFSQDQSEEGRLRRAKHGILSRIGRYSLPGKVRIKGDEIRISLTAKDAETWDYFLSSCMRWGR